MKNVTTHIGKQFDSFLKSQTYIKHTYEPVIVLPRYFTKENENICPYKHLYEMFITALFVITETGNTPSVPQQMNEQYDT